MPSCRATSCFHAHTTHPNLTCFPQFFREGRVGRDGIGWGGVGWFLFLLSSSSSLPPPPCFLPVSQYDVHLFLFEFFSFPCHCFLSALLLLLLSSPPPPPPLFFPVSPPLCFSLLRLTGLCLYVVCSFRPTPCIAG